ncbi:hypothetical protein I2492_06200 [Budviciaceae bacterium CWB-B4]|uniref:Uncharacterized protein n=1 Tax=Limnobaculum xujianqingii TaxID=2738837 RepID=A0A9D7FX06_9GAMM|nr:hypothetical protein [Limnobaculum xujianqingii]MBK5072601.1 hypothetical protein [Limnobaculum xujianqingii]MBK5175910.1 hypothetical protein [Limnobaculum xujianqingii]
MKNSLLKPPLCVGDQYRRSDYGARQIQRLTNRCYTPLNFSRSLCYSPAASLLCVLSSKKVESMGEYGYVY